MREDRQSHLSDNSAEPQIVNSGIIDENTDECVILPRDSWDRLLAIVRQPDYPKQIVFNNQDIKEILQVSDSLVRKYRESGILPFSSDGNKIWYTIHDIHAFLSNNHYN